MRIKRIIRSSVVVILHGGQSGYETQLRRSNTCGREKDSPRTKTKKREQREDVTTNTFPVPFPSMLPTYNAFPLHNPTTKRHIILHLHFHIHPIPLLLDLRLARFRCYDNATIVLLPTSSRCTDASSCSEPSTRSIHVLLALHVHRISHLTHAFPVVALRNATRPRARPRRDRHAAHRRAREGPPAAIRG